MFLERYLTEYDESLSGESYIDPIGTLVIWSAYGQEIFRNRVNSIANDVRNYTINLFNHHVIRRLIRDETALLSNKLTNVYGGKDTLFFKYACLLYLENLFVFSILKHEDRKGIDSSGVLGITKGRRLWAEKDINLRLVFSVTRPRSWKLAISTPTTIITSPAPQPCGRTWISLWLPRRWERWLTRSRIT